MINKKLIQANEKKLEYFYKFDTFNGIPSFINHDIRGLIQTLNFNIYLYSQPVFVYIEPKKLGQK